MKKAIVRCAVLTLFLAALPVTAQTRAWSAVGSTGSIDETSLGSYAVNTTSLFHQSAAVGTVVARYNVTNTSGGTDTPPWTTLEMTYFDIDAGSTVSATLIQVDRCTGFPRTICSVTSVDATSQRCVSCTFPAGTTINFATSLYVVEARVTRSATNDLPQLIGLRIF
jgi:hypothetical protein